MRLIILSLCFLYSLTFFTQDVFYQDIFKGGISSYTYGNSAYGIESNGIFLNNIPLGSSVRKAFFFIVAEGNDSLSIDLDNKRIHVDSLNSISPPFLSYSHNADSKNAEIYCLDITNMVFTDINTVPIVVHDFSDSFLHLKNRFTSSTLVILFDNASLPVISVSLVTNQLNADSNVNYNIQSLNPINNQYPFSLAAITSYSCDTINDGSYVSVNNTPIGLIGGKDNNTNYSCSGIYGCFAHYNNTSYGLDDDTPDSLMNGSDALADIKNFVNYGDDSVIVNFRYKKTNHPTSSSKTNPIRYLFLAHSTKCDTLHSHVNTNDTTICAGEPLVLKVGGDSTYSYAWRYKGNIMSTDSIININPEHSKLYSILVSDTSGCSKTEIINIKVNEKPIFDITTSDAICPNNNGNVVISNVQGIAPPFKYSKNNEAWQTAAVYGSLSEGNYTIGVLDTNNCVTAKQVNIVSINNTIADYSYSTPLPFVPASIVFNNQSQNSTEYQWFVDGSLITNTADLEQLFEQDGEYIITLVANKANEQCSDTLTKTIKLDRENYLYIPTSFGKENTLTLYSSGYVKLEFTLINGLGQIVTVLATPIISGEQNLLGNKDLARGVYFYEIKATKENGEEILLGGKVMKI